MSKTDELRAMREAKYARAAAAQSGQAPSGQAPAQPKAAPKKAKAEPKVAPEAAATAETDGLCGHRSMNGRSCTREAGHAAKSHRYA